MCNLNAVVFHELLFCAMRHSLGACSDFGDARDWLAAVAMATNQLRQGVSVPLEDEDEDEDARVATLVDRGQV